MVTFAEIRRLPSELTVGDAQLLSWRDFIIVSALDPGNKLLSCIGIYEARNLASGSIVFSHRALPSSRVHLAILNNEYLCACYSEYQRSKWRNIVKIFQLEADINQPMTEIDAVFLEGVRGNIFEASQPLGAGEHLIIPDSRERKILVYHFERNINGKADFIKFGEVTNIIDIPYALQTNGSILFVSSRNKLLCFELRQVLNDPAAARAIASWTHPSDPNIWIGPYAQSSRRLAIAAPYEARGEPNAGAVYIFDCELGSNTFGRLTAGFGSPDILRDSLFGMRLEYYGERLVVMDQGHWASNPIYRKGNLLAEFDESLKLSGMERLNDTLIFPRGAPYASSTEGRHGIVFSGWSMIVNADGSERSWPALLRLK